MKTVLAFVLALSPTVVGATTLDFSDLTFAGSSEFSANFVGSPYVSNGYRFVSTDGALAGFDASRYLAFGDMNPRNADQGGATLVSNRQGALNTLTRDGGAFDLLSLDLSGVTAFGPTGGSISIYADGDVASATTLSFDSDTALTAFMLPFRNVTSVSFIGLGDTDFYQLDNVVVNAAAVPEPASWAMAIAGFGFVGGALRRRLSTTRLSFGR